MKARLPRCWWILAASLLAHGCGADLGLELHERLTGSRQAPDDPDAELAETNGAGATSPSVSTPQPPAATFEDAYEPVVVTTPPPEEFQPPEPSRQAASGGREAAMLPRALRPAGQRHDPNRQYQVAPQTSGDPQTSGAQTPAPTVEPESPTVMLSTGVALPQSLPTGTTMGFSVNYRFLGTPTAGASYRWVIRSPTGKTYETRFQPRREGTLSTFVHGWGPDQGSYETHVEEVTRYGRKRIGRKLSLYYAR